ncbi:MAG: transcription termination/antitermination factor NusG [Dictyoglomus sp. NZ13-RE01]|nr:MAG: transcription termination/antitermination factor NusG [Dictyoglomus sp. NZ13-RE01]
MSEAKWYVIHTLAGHEHKVKAIIERQIKLLHLDDKIFEIIVPEEKVMVVRGGRKIIQSKKVFPGYLFIKMVDDEEAQRLIRNTAGVTGFVGAQGKPSPLNPEEEHWIRKFIEQKEIKPELKVKKGDKVYIKSGPFMGYEGRVEEVYPEKGTVVVLLSIFGRETPTEIDHSQVEKTD